MGASLLAVAKSIYYDEDKLLFVTSIEKIHTIMVGTTNKFQGPFKDLPKTNYSLQGLIFIQ